MCQESSLTAWGLGVLSGPAPLQTNIAHDWGHPTADLPGVSPASCSLLRCHGYQAVEVNTAGLRASTTLTVITTTLCVGQTLIFRKWLTC
jgi:hypothetical protein